MKTYRRHFLLFVAGCALLAASLACAGALLPASGAPPAAEPELEPDSFSPPPINLTAVASMEPMQPQPQPGIPERRRVSLEFPPRIRSGDSDIIRLTLEIDDLGGLTPTAESEGNQITGRTVEIPNLYETHNVRAEARLDMAGVEIRPPETISSPLAPGQAVTFYWSVRPLARGTFKGTAWLLLRFEDKITGAVRERAISAQTVQIQSTDLFGFSAGFARTTGAVGSVIGGIIGFPFFEDILKLILRRSRKR